MLMHQFAETVDFAGFESALDLVAELLGEMRALQHLPSADRPALIFAAGPGAACWPAAYASAG